MQHERQVILSLVALGRITPREAERLLAATDVAREETWAFLMCITACMVQAVPALVNLAHALLPGGLSSVSHAVAAITRSLGGVL